MVLYSSDAPHPSLPFQLESIPPNWLPEPFHTIEEKAQLFPLPLATFTHSALSCAHAGTWICLTAKPWHAALACPEVKSHMHCQSELVDTELFSFVYLWGKSMEMVKLWLSWESVKRSCFALVKSPYSLLKNRWAHFGFHDSLYATVLALGVTRLLCAHLVQGFPRPQLQHHLWVSHWTHFHNAPGRQTHICIHMIQGLSSKAPFKQQDASQVCAGNILSCGTAEAWAPCWPLSQLLPHTVCRAPLAVS